MWMTARFLPCAPLSLKPALATSSGGKTLLVITPYAIKMALLGVALQTYDASFGESLFPILRDLSIAMAPPNNFTVFKTFQKIRRPFEYKDSKKPKGDETQEDADARFKNKIEEKKEWGEYPHQSTISFREYLLYQGPFELAFAASAEVEPPAVLTNLLQGINYFGKRGGFVQLLTPPQHVVSLSERFILLNPKQEQPSKMHPESILQMLDDCSAELTFQQANIYSPEQVTLGKERVLHHVILPYRQVSWSRSYSWYQRIRERA